MEAIQKDTRRVTLMNLHYHSLTCIAMKTHHFLDAFGRLIGLGWNELISTTQVFDWLWLPFPSVYLHPMGKFAFCFSLLNPSVILAFCGQNYKHPAQKDKINPVK